MTTEQPIDQGGNQPGAPFLPNHGIATHRLRRRTSDRVIGGVAGGLGDYLNVDPILLRAGFAGLMIFGGAGLVLYVLGWILIPAQGQDDSIVEAAIHRFAQRFGRLGPVAVVLVALIVLSPWLLNRYDSFYVPPEVFIALAVALIGLVLLIPRGRIDAQATAASVPGPADAGRWQGAAVAAVVAAATPRPPRERSPLGWYVLAGALLLVAGLAVVANVALVRVTPGQYFGAGLLALGIGLVAGAWWGRARFVGLLGILILPAAAGAAFLTVPLEGGIGRHDYQPLTLAEVAPAYHIVGGRLTIDLSQLKAGSQPVKVEASVGVGNLYVIVPRNATVEVAGTVQGGELMLFGRDHVGTDLTDHVSEAGGPGGVSLVLTLDTGIGRVWIERSTLEAN